jgi:phosphatidylglycerophosphatase C
LKRRIAFFDFDGTITTKDTLLEVIKNQKGILKSYLGFFINSPFLIAYKAGLISNSTAKQKILRFFFKAVPLSSFQAACDKFAVDVLPLLIRRKALNEIKKLQELGTEVVIVSASAENWIKKWSDSVNATLIATKLEVKENKITGCIEGNNCYGEEKTRRIKALYDLSQYDEVYCYGDTEGDKPMLSLGTITFYKPFR